MGIVDTRTPAALQILQRELAQRSGVAESALRVLCRRIEDAYVSAVDDLDLFQELARRHCTTAEALQGLLLATLERERGNRTAAARRLKVSVRTVYNLLQRLGVLSLQAAREAYPGITQPFSASRRAGLQALYRELARRHAVISDPEFSSLAARFEEDCLAVTSRELLFRELARRHCTLAEVKIALLVATLEREDGNRTAAAKQLDISVRTVHNRLNRLGVPPRRPPQQTDPEILKVLAEFRANKGRA